MPIQQFRYMRKIWFCNSKDVHYATMKNMQHVPVSLMSIIRHADTLVWKFKINAQRTWFLWAKYYDSVRYIIDTFDDIWSLLELFRFSNASMNTANYVARHIYAVQWKEKNLGFDLPPKFPKFLSRHIIFYDKVDIGLWFYTNHMARGYEPGGHICLNLSKISTFTYAPNPGSDLEIFDCFQGPVPTL